MTALAANGPSPKAQYPRQIPYIIGNEACERFSFYGMRNILTQFLASSVILAALGSEVERKAGAKEVFHVFVIGVYFFPLLGGWLSDRFLGKYRTILYLSLVYCLGHLLLALFPEDKTGFYAGLFFIALGSGGIKPCVSAFVGEQFDTTNKHLARVVFDAFYWIINFGSFFASLFIPWTLAKWGAEVAFGIPGLLMFIATLIFWLGRKLYVVEPPQPADPHSFYRVVASAIRGGGTGQTIYWAGVALAAGALVVGAVDVQRQFFAGAEPYIGVVSALCLALVFFLASTAIAASLQIEEARGHHPDEDVDGARSVLKVLVLFALVTPFWSLFDQKASTWVLQGQGMAMPEWMQSASQMQSLNPLLVMLLIPFNNLVLYPWLRKIGVEPSPLRKMTAGIALAGFAWIWAGLLQLDLDGGDKPSILWQVGPYLVLTLGEVLVSATGLEFAYSQAPLKMKGVLMSFWSLGVTVGNLWVLLVNSTVKGASVTKAIESTGFGVTSFQMFFFAAFAFAAALAFGAYARRYDVVDHYRRAS
ncbi:oligopeptide:H+ symporter [Myxococcota bacterium]|nr:oligopeptide:H+ symporter [Myxococcota bacterium]